MALPFFQFYLRLQLSQVEFCGPAFRSGFLGFFLNVGNVPLDCLAGPIFPRPTAGRDFDFQDPLLGQLLDPADRIPQQLCNGGCAGSLRRRSGQHRRLVTLFLLRHRQHLLFCPGLPSMVAAWAGSGGTAVFAFPVLGGFAFSLFSFWRLYPPKGGYNFSRLVKIRNVTTQKNFVPVDEISGLPSPRAPFSSREDPSTREGSCISYVFCHFDPNFWDGKQ